MLLCEQMGLRRRRTIFTAQEWRVSLCGERLICVDDPVLFYEEGNDESETEDRALGARVARVRREMNR